MTKKFKLTLDKTQKQVILAITFGNILEWYDFYLYIFWSPTLATLFCNDCSPSVCLLFIVALYAIGFIFRPLGGVFFGRLGDFIGRKKAFIGSLLMMSIPTFLMGFIPTYSQIGPAALFLLAFLRIAQTFPSGGELPGAFCYLYEAGQANKKFTSSFAGVGNQIGIILAALECYILKANFSEAWLSTTGWRVAFIVGGLIGSCGIFLRYKLHETKSFQELMSHHKIVKTPIRSVFQANWGRILRGISFGTMQTVCFHFISVLFPLYFFNFIGLDNLQHLIATITLLVVTTIPLPIYGWLAEKYNVKTLAIGSCLGTLLLLYPLHDAVNSLSPRYVLLTMGIMAICVACLTALWPYFLSHLFPTRIRYTCVGLSFNIGDGVIGGLSSLFILYFISIENIFTFFTWTAAVSCIISIASCLKIKLVDGAND